MNKDEILRKALGDGIVVLAKEAGRAARNKREIHRRIADSLRQMFGSLRRGSKSAPDEAS